MLAYCIKLKLTEIALTKSRMLAFCMNGHAQHSSWAFVSHLCCKHKRAAVNNCF